MSTAVRKPMTVAEFLAWEERQELRYEFDGVGPRAMTGGTVRHDRITFNLHRALDARLGGCPCRSYGPNVKILAGGNVRYPDAVMTCSALSENATVVDDPVVVFEIVSSGNARIDRIVKVREYQAAPSIRRYVIVEQESIGATVFERRGDLWGGFALTEGDTLQLPEVGIELPLAECYTGLDLASLPDEPV